MLEYLELTPGLALQLGVLARDLAWAAGPRWQGRRAAPDAGAPRLKEEAFAVRR